MFSNGLDEIFSQIIETLEGNLVIVTFLFFTKEVFYFKSQKYSFLMFTRFVLLHLKYNPKQMFLNAA